MTGAPLTPPEHEHGALHDEALQHLHETPRSARPPATIPYLKARFGLSTSQAVAVVREYNLRMARAV